MLKDLISTALLISYSSSSGDKRLVFIQMEGLTGLSAKDEWNFEHDGYTNHPFIKSNYPHHEGAIIYYIYVSFTSQLSKINLFLSLNKLLQFQAFGRGVIR